jgi:hypothetical protein
MDASFDECTRVCCECRQECLRTMQFCLNKGGKFADSRLCLRLAEAMRLSQLAADCCTTGSEALRTILESCAGECEETARCCDALAEPELTRCADKLRACAAACRKPAAAGSPGASAQRHQSVSRE